MKKIMACLLSFVLLLSCFVIPSAILAEETGGMYVYDAEALSKGICYGGAVVTLSDDGSYVTYSDGEGTDPQVHYSFAPTMKAAPYMLVKYRAEQSVTATVWMSFDPVVNKSITFSASSDWSYTLVDFTTADYTNSKIFRFDMLDNASVGVGLTYDVAEIRFFETAGSANDYIASNVMYVYDAEALSKGNCYGGAVITLSADGSYVTYSDGTGTDPQILYNFIYTVKAAPYMLVKYRAAKSVNATVYLNTAGPIYRSFTFDAITDWSYMLVDFTTANYTEGNFSV